MPTNASPPPPYRVAYVGSRAYPRFAAVADSLLKLAAWAERHDRRLVIVSGTNPPPLHVARNRPDGVDEMAIRLARWLGLETAVHAPDYRRLGRAAALDRNPAIVAGCDQLVAFWDQKSRGTARTIRLALGAGKLGRVYGATGRPLAVELVEGEVRRALGER